MGLPGNVRIVASPTRFALVAHDVSVLVRLEGPREPRGESRCPSERSSDEEGEWGATNGYRNVPDMRDVQRLTINRRSPIDRSTPLEELPEFLSPEEFRAYLGLSRSTVYELLRRREIPSRRFGKCIRIPKSALEKVE